MSPETRRDANCLFCKIVSGEIPATEIARSESAIVIKDVSPKAPTHLLVIPTTHAANLGEFAAIAPNHEVGELFMIASKAGRDAGGGGYRIVVNEGPDAGQTVFHLHLHVLAGRAMSWPPG